MNEHATMNLKYILLQHFVARFSPNTFYETFFAESPSINLRAIKKIRVREKHLTLFS